MFTFSRLFRGVIKDHENFRRLRSVDDNCLRKMTNQSISPWKFIYISCPDNPIYLKRTTSHELRETESESRKLSDVFKTDSGHFLLFPKHDTNATTYAEMGYVMSAIDSMKFYRKSAIWTHCMFAHSVQFSQDDGFHKRGVYVKNFNPESISSFTQDVAQISDLTVYKLVKEFGGSGTFVMRMLSDMGENGSKVVDLDDEEICLHIVERTEMDATELGAEKNISPIFSIPNLTPVFHEFNRTRNLLTKLSNVPEVKELLQIVDEHVTGLPKVSCEETLSYPFVVVEGMDATGKTTLTEHLEKRLGAVRYYTPPAQITHLRAFFDKYPEIVRRAYYSMGNYIVATEIIRECQTRPVIMDRFWHSTAAYGIANETSSGDMPGADHSVYTWPVDLLKPSLVLFLTVTEDVRKQRLSDRGVQATFEEKSLDRDQLFRQRLCEAYRRMRNPNMVEIDAGGTVEEVQALAMKVLKKHGIKLKTGGTGDRSRMHTT